MVLGQTVMLATCEPVLCSMFSVSDFAAKGFRSASVVKYQRSGFTRSAVPNLYRRRSQAALGKHSDTIA